jgi:hypothetical protein
VTASASSTAFAELENQYLPKRCNDSGLPRAKSVLPLSLSGLIAPKYNSAPGSPVAKFSG